MEITSKMIIKADGTTGQNINKGTGVKTPHIQDGAITRPKIRNGSVSSSIIREADGTTGQDANKGWGIKTPHIQDGAVTESKLGDNSVTYEKMDSPTREKLVTNGDHHDHSGGDGAQIKHSSLTLDGGSNPHRVGMSQLNDLNANNRIITNLADPVQNNDAANKIYIDVKTGGTVSSSSNIENVTTSHSRQVNASYYSTASNDHSQVNASYQSTAKGTRSQVNASEGSTASGWRSQVNASGPSTANGKQSQVNASNQSTASNMLSQVNASYYSTASGAESQVNASYNSKASRTRSQVNASWGVETGSDFTVCGGYGEGATSPANRKWELDSANGNITHAGSIRSQVSFSDYGEYFENLTKGEIDMGTLIALEGAKVRPAKKDEDFIGVVSGTAAIRLGDSSFCWQGRYMKDEWGRAVYEEIKDPTWEPKTVPDKKWKSKDGETEADRPMIAVETEKDRPNIRVQKENPDYDPGKEQVPRSERPKEWTLVGLLGQVYIRCDETVKPGDFVKSKDKGIGTKSEVKTKLRAMKVTKEFDGKYSIVYCLLN